MTDRYVFGENRGGRFLVTQQGCGGVTEPAFCATCGHHRVQAPGQDCPCCDGGAA
jgi:hypothetical protein